MSESELNKLLTYREICQIMEDEEVQGGKNRVNQLSKWQKFYDIEKIGTKYVIKKVYDDEEISFVKNKDSISGYFANLIVDYLTENNYESVTMTYRELFEALWVVNKKYYPVKYNNEDIDIIVPNDFDEEIVRYNITMFYKRSESILKEMLKTAIEKLYNASLVTTQDTFVLYKKDGKAIIRKECNSDDITKILNIQREGLNRCGLKNLSDVKFASKQTQDYYDSFVRKQTKEQLDCDFFARAFTFICATEGRKRSKFNRFDFNQKMVEKFLNAKRMKRAVNESINEQLVDKLIKV